MASMQELRFIAPGKIEWREVPRPELNSDRAALVKPMAVTRCDLDYYIATGLIPVPGSFAMGHETFGIVEEIGDEVRTVKPGDEVVVSFQICCGSCEYCLLGFTNACRGVPKYSAFGLKHSSGTEWGGALADRMCVPYADAMLVRASGSLSDTAHAAIADNAADGYRTVARVLREDRKQDVLVVGGLATSVGLYAVQAANALGASVTYLDQNANNRKKALEVGAQAAYDPEAAPDSRYPVVVDAASTASGLVQALKSTAPCGHCTSVSNGTSSTAVVPARQMYMDGITWEISRVHARTAAGDYLDLAAREELDPDAILSHRVSFTEAGAAMTEPAVKMAFVRD